MTAGSDEPEDESPQAAREKFPERQGRQNGEEPSGAEADAETDAPDAELGEWRFSVTDVSEPEDEDGDEEGNVAGILMRNEPLEPGSIDSENAFFFLLGSLGTILFVVLAVTGL